MRSLEEIAIETLGCAVAWNEGARLLGNVTAMELAALAIAQLRPSRREQRRARKAAKNRVMYKLVGRRPWADGYQDEALGDGTCCRDSYHTEYRLDHLRERSGFLDMSRLADALNDRMVSFSELRDELSQTVYKDVVSILSEPNAFLSKMTKRGK